MTEIRAVQDAVCIVHNAEFLSLQSERGILYTYVAVAAARLFTGGLAPACGAVDALIQLAECIEAK
jgi:hypothetical protein